MTISKDTLLLAAASIVAGKLAAHGATNAVGEREDLQPALRIRDELHAAVHEVIEGIIRLDGDTSSALARFWHD